MFKVIAAVGMVFAAVAFAPSSAFALGPAGLAKSSIPALEHSNLATKVHRRYRRYYRYRRYRKYRRYRRRPRIYLRFGYGYPRYYYGRRYPRIHFGRRYRRWHSRRYW